MDEIDTRVAAIAAQEVKHLEPGAQVEVDADVAAFPAPFSQLTPGHDAVQAVLDRDHSYNYTGRGPGALVSGEVLVSIEDFTRREVVLGDDREGLYKDTAWEMYALARPGSKRPPVSAPVAPGPTPANR
jgi:hypothetical protein